MIWKGRLLWNWIEKQPNQTIFLIMKCFNKKMIFVIFRWSYNCQGEHLCSQLLKDWWRENGGWLKFWASYIVYFWKWNLWIHPQFWLGWKGETQAMSKSRMDKNIRDYKKGEKGDLVLLIFVNHLFAVFSTILKDRVDALHFLQSSFNERSLQLYHGLPPHQNVTSLEIEKWELVGSLIRVWTHWKFSAGFQLPSHNAASLEIYKPNPENEIEFWVVIIEEVQLPNQK